MTAKQGIGERSDSGFAEENRSYLQTRLRLSFRVFSIAVAVGLVVLIGVEALIDHSLVAGIQGVALNVPGPIFVAFAAAGGIFAVLAGRVRFSNRTLGMLDLVMLQVLFAAFLVPYAQKPYYSEPLYSVTVAALTATVLVRAVLVPSTFWRTLLGSATAPLLVLAADLASGRRVMTPRMTIQGDDATTVLTAPYYSESHFAFTTILHQIILWAAVFVAASASRLNTGLRRRVHDAARVGSYELGPMIGSGAMGQVYRATHALLKRPTAIKFLRPEITGDETLARFEHEVQQTSRLSHPNTVSIYDYGHTADGVFYYAMELLDGLTLREVVDRDGPQSAARVIHVVSAVCSALVEAHAAGMVHRDVKAENIMLCRQGGELDVVKLLDFGLVKDLGPEAKSMTMDGAILGTPETMAPEVLFCESVGSAADVYSLCAVAYTMLTARPLFEVDSLGALLEAHKNEAPRPPSEHVDVPADLEAAILSGLAKDPSRRPSAATLRDALARCADAGRWDRGDAGTWWAGKEPARTT